MKAITPIIGIIILLLIVIALVGSASTFLFGTFESLTAKTIQVTQSPGLSNRLIIKNLGTSTIQLGEIEIAVEGREAFIMNPQPIAAGQSRVFDIIPYEAKERVSVRITGPTNTINTNIDATGGIYEGLVLLHHADSSEGLTVRDSSEFGNHGTLQGNAFVNETACIGGAYQFDGDGDYIDVTDDSSLDLTKFTLAAWVKFNTAPATSADQYIIEKGTDSNTFANYYLWYDQGAGACGDDVLCSGFRSTSGSWRDHPYSWAPQAGVWYHTLSTFNGNDFKIYINGTEVLSEAETNTPLTGNGNLRIGARRDAAMNFNGTIDEVAIWNRVLGQSEITQLYQMGVDAGCV